MNEAVMVSDILFAAYRDFPNSSNLLTKAAFYQKPILVSDGHLMAERVKKYKMGEVVDEGNIVQICATLCRMLDPKYFDKLKEQARWDEYYKNHSVVKLREAMSKLLKTL